MIRTTEKVIRFEGYVHELYDMLGRTTAGLTIKATIRIMADKDNLKRIEMTEDIFNEERKTL